MATPSRSEFEDELQADAERVCRPHPANATAAASPETLRDIAKQKSLQGHPFVRLALRNAADEMERLRAERDKIVKWLDRPRYFGDRYVREGYDTATDDVRRILDAE